ncbi:MAG: (Fe-S)-binding protein [Deltaproteobacteria bacterium]|nr:(Fe-S)-binding protein [Deltaproteobacteria bacterium]
MAINSLISMLGALDAALSLCTRCGLCQAVCPVYSVTGNEADAARGKIFLLDGLASHLFDDPAGVSERLDRCLLCGACEAECPRGIKITQTYIAARSILAEYMGLSLGKKVLFRQMLARPERFDRLAAWAARFQWLVTRPAGLLSSPVSQNMVSPLLINRWVPALPITPFHRMEIPERPTEVKGHRVAIFAGCLIDKVFPDIAVAMIEALKYHRADISVPAGQGCCGIPALSSGDMKSFQSLVALNLERFNPDDFDWLVTGCATCTAVIKKIWPEMSGWQIGSKNHVRLKRISEKTIDFSGLMIDIIGVAPMKTGSSSPLVTYHDPCHLKNSLGVMEAPRKLLCASNAFRFAEMKDADTCCGMGGGFCLSFPDISRSLGDRKRDRIMGSGADVVATSCPACMIQLADLSITAPRSFGVRHVAQIYADGLRLCRPQPSDAS